MDLTELEIELASLVLPKEAYSSEGLCNRLAELVREDRWDEVSRRVPKIAATIRAIADQSGKDECIDTLRTLGAEEAARATETIRQSIRGATSFHVRGSLGDALVQLHRRAEEQNLKSNLLAIAFADRLTDLVFPASERAARFTELVVRQQPSPQAGKYLEEACLCHFYELYSACAVMCRSVLEEVVENRIRRLGLNLDMNAGDHTLGELLRVAQSPEFRGRNVIPPEAVHEVKTVMRLGNVAAHQSPIREEDAQECLLAARHAISCLMQT